MKKVDIKIGFIPTRRNGFEIESATVQKNIILEKLKSDNYSIIDINDVTDDGFLVTSNDTEKVLKKFNEIETDALFFPHCNFGTEGSVGKVAKTLNKPVLLWGPRDEAPLEDGTRLRDTQCGLFATSNVFTRLGISFSYIHNCNMSDLAFNRGFNNFIKATNVIKVFKNIRIGQIGVRPEHFWTVICNEGEILEKFGIEVIPFNLVDISTEALDLIKNPTPEYIEDLESIKKILTVEIEEEILNKMISLRLAIKKLAREKNINAFAIQCVKTLLNILGIFPCFSNSMLFDEKIPVACEMDINGAISSLIAQAATLNEKPVFFADFTIRHPSNNNAELLWHCGSFPYSIRKDKDKLNIGKMVLDKKETTGICNWEIKGGDISLVRFDGIKNKYSLFAGQAKGISGPKTNGTYLWIEVKNWSEWEEKLIFGPYIHHVAGIHGNISPVLFEACRYIDGLRFDPVEPDENEIKKWIKENN